MGEENQENKQDEEKKNRRFLLTCLMAYLIPAIGPIGGTLGFIYKILKGGLSSSQKYFIFFVISAFAMMSVVVVVLFFFLFCEIPGTGFLIDSCDIFDTSELSFTGVPSSSPSFGASQSSQVAGDKCEPCDSGFADPDNLKNTIATNSVLQANCGSSFDPVIASRVASAESSCNSYQSTMAKCGSDGTEFAIGLFQINMTVHEIYDAEGKAVTMADSQGTVYHCKDVFSGRNLDCRRKTGAFYDDLYKKCYDTLRTGKDAALANLVNACKIQKSEGWDAWVAYSDYKDCRDPNITS